MAAAIETGWEMLENSPVIMDRYRTATIALGYSGDSIANSLSDLAICMLGYIFASKLSFRSAVITVVLIELISTATIRDGLFLNILMLIYPVDAIREWQMMK